MSSTTSKIDLPFVLVGVLGLWALSLFLAEQVSLKISLLLLVGSAMGFALMQALFGFTGAWRQMTRDRRSRGMRGMLVLLGLTSLLLFPVFGGLFPELKVHAALAPVGVSVLVGSFVFGIGMQLGNGCGSGTLFTVGWGHIKMLITLGFFIIGAFIGSIHLPWWMALPNIGKVSVLQPWGWQAALTIQLVVLFILYRWVSSLELKRQGFVQPLSFRPEHEAGSLLQHAIFGQWPILWAVIALAVLNLLTVLLAGFPWSITFAFGLWAAKIWTALGGDVNQWLYWSQGYPAQALQHSVLQDTVSVMDFGIILGALLAASLMGRFAPPEKIRRPEAIAAMIGGLCMGYGARLAFGCNIGGLLAGISSGSLHGWLWFVSGFIGSSLGVRIRIMAGLDKPVGVK